MNLLQNLWIYFPERTTDGNKKFQSHMQQSQYHQWDIIAISMWIFL